MFKDNKTGKKERFNAAFEYLKNRGLVHMQRDLAEAIGTTESNISHALKGDEKALTDSLCMRLSRAYDMISAQWLICGDGEMVINNNINNNFITSDNIKNFPDYSSLINAALAAKDDNIMSLKRELADKEESFRRERDAKNETIQELRSRLEDKDEYITSLKQRMQDLRGTIELLRSKGILDDYPFRTGASDEGERPLV